MLRVQKSLLPRVPDLVQEGLKTAAQPLPSRARGTGAHCGVFIFLASWAPYAVALACFALCKCWRG